MDTRARAGEAREDQVTGAIESVTAKVPSVSFLGMALGAMAASWIFKLAGRDGWANFIAQWAPSLLIMGLYNKTVKQQGSDAESRYGSGSHQTEFERPDRGTAATL